MFAMTENGLKDVSHPSAIFSSRDAKPAPGSVVTVIREGTRPLLIEVQALLDESHLDMPRRLCVGYDPQRLSMLLAVLHKHAGVKTYNQDVFVNIIGGIRTQETSVDLAIAAAILSSLNDKVFPADTICLGEIGLSGELRPVLEMTDRLREAERHGFKKAIIPAQNANKIKEVVGITVRGIKELKELHNEC
jgi:DNA repair protein RadA/Sms